MDPLFKSKLITNRLEKHFGIPQWQRQGNPLDSLILTVLSQSTNDRNRDLAYQRLKQRFPTWELVKNAQPAEIADAIRPAGLGNQKSVRIKNILQWVNDTYFTLDLSFICDMEPQDVINIFTQLKGVGIKTISVVLMFTCGVDIFPVDTHVFRICKRLGLVPQKVNAEKTHHFMQPIVPKGKSFSLHMNLLKLGRTICKAQKPRCLECPIKDLCPSLNLYYKKESN